MTLKDVRAFRCLDISTSHMTEDDSILLAGMAKENKSVVRYPEGFFIRTNGFSEIPQLGFSQGLRTIMKWSFNHDIEVVNFDGDGCVYPQWIQYRWR